MTFKTNDLQNIFYSSMVDAINVTINNLYLYVPNLIPNVETQVMFNEATRINYKTSFDEWYTEKRVLSDTVTQLDIGTSQHVNSPKYLIGAHQTRTRADTANKNNNIAIFDNLNLQKFYVEIDSIRYPRDSVLINYGQNDYIECFKDLNLFFKEYIGEELMAPFTSYTDMKTKYPIQIVDLGHQTDHITRKKFIYFKNIVLIPRKSKF